LQRDEFLEWLSPRPHFIKTFDRHGDNRYLQMSGENRCAFF
jgi:hypothetical protein